VANVESARRVKTLQQHCVFQPVDNDEQSMRRNMHITRTKEHDKRTIEQTDLSVVSYTSKSKDTVTGHSPPHSVELANKSISSEGLLLMLQVAQLWQKDHAKLGTFSINVQYYSQNYAQNCIFGPPYGASGAISALSESFNLKNFVAQFDRQNVSFTRKGPN